MKAKDGFVRVAVNGRAIGTCNERAVSTDGFSLTFDLRDLKPLEGDTRATIEGMLLNSTPIEIAIKFEQQAYRGKAKVSHVGKGSKSGLINVIFRTTA